MDGKNKGHILSSAKHTAIAVSAIVFGLAAVSQATVFFRTGEHSTLDKLLEARGGTKIYESEVKINGGKGALTVYGFDTHLNRLLEDLKQSVTGDFTAPGGMAIATVKSGGSVSRLVAVRLDSRAQSVIFKLTQTESEYEASTKPVSLDIAGVPPYPGSRPSLSINNADTSTSLGVSTASAPSADILRFYDAGLKAAGWKPLNETTSASLLVYGKGDSVCCVLATQAQDASLSTITLLHKQKKME